MQCIEKLELTPTKDLNPKLELVAMANELLPAGRPNFKDLVQYPTITQLVKTHGAANMTKVLYLLVKDFCSSLNLIRPMNEDQMIEAAGTLLSECGNFRLEDYVMMFTLGKRGQLGKILDRMDIQVIGMMHDAYYAMRHNAGQAIQEKAFKEVDERYKDIRVPVPETPEEKQQSAVFSRLKETFTDWGKQEAMKEQQRQEARNKQIAAYAQKMNIDIDEVVKQFGKKQH